MATLVMLGVALSRSKSCLGLVLVAVVVIAVVGFYVVRRERRRRAYRRQAVIVAYSPTENDPRHDKIT